MDPLQIKTYEAGGTINPCRFVKHGSADYETVQATDASAQVLGVSDQVGIETGGSWADGERLDVIKAGIALLKLGGTVTRGDILVPDADGKGVAGSIVAGEELHYGAIAEVSGVDGDVIPVQVFSGAIANDTGIVTEDVTITSEDLLALNATEQEIIAAPGAGKAIIVEDAQFFLDYNSTAYDGIAAGEDLALKYTDDSGDEILQVETTGFLDATADAYRQARPTTDADHTPVANAPVVLHLLAGEIATGNSPLKVRVRYRTVDVTW